MTEQEVLAMPLCLHFDPQKFQFFVQLLQRLLASELYHHSFFGIAKLHLSPKHVPFFSRCLFKLEAAEGKGWEGKEKVTAVAPEISDF